jgi:hypothetical protein
VEAYRAPRHRRWRVVPDYELRDHSGTKRKPSELEGADPMIPVLSRGAFCTKDREQHRLLLQMEPEYKVAYANPTIPHTLVFEPGLVI